MAMLVGVRVESSVDARHGLVQTGESHSAAEKKNASAVAWMIPTFLPQLKW